MKLRYVGAVPTTFVDPAVGELSPGDEFTVDDDTAAAYFTRADVEKVTDPDETPVPLEEEAPPDPVTPARRSRTAKTN